MKIAIIGSGFFGATIALKLSKSHKIDLFEKEKDILNGASKINQFRFHLGFHYPRSKKTINEIKSSYKLFTNFFSNKVFGKTKNYYSISNEESKINFKKYLKVLKNSNLKYKIIRKKKQFDKISNFILTNEKILNYFLFKKIIKKKIKNSKINLLLKSKFTEKNIKNYDKVIICCYSENNKILKNLGIRKSRRYQYELVEKILIKLPQQYKNKSYVIMDGKFVCLDPYLGTKYHLLSDVKNSKIEIVKKKFPIFNSYKKKYLNNKINKNIKISNFNKFIKHSSNYLPFLKEAKYIGSYFIIRTLKPNMEKTDERTGEIQILNNKIISIFSSKWNTSVYIAQKLKNILN